MKSDLVDIVVHKHAETAKAILVSDDGDEKKAKWIPKSYCEFVALNGRTGPFCTLTLPEWLALDKGLI